MKKFNWIIIGAILFLTVGLTMAVITISKVNNTKNLPRNQIDKILERANRGGGEDITQISVQIDDPVCSNGYCIFNAQQPNIIDKRFKIPTSFTNCTETNVTFIKVLNGSTVRVENCITEVTRLYTDTELRDLADQYVEDKLESYASALIEREDTTKKSIGGKLEII